MFATKPEGQKIILCFCLVGREMKITFSFIYIKILFCHFSILLPYLEKGERKKNSLSNSFFFGNMYNRLKENLIYIKKFLNINIFHLMNSSCTTSIAHTCIGVLEKCTIVILTHYSEICVLCFMKWRSEIHQILP